MYIVNVNYTFVNFIMTDYGHPLKFMLGPVISQSVERISVKKKFWTIICANIAWFAILLSDAMKLSAA